MAAAPTKEALPEARPTAKPGWGVSTRLHRGVSRCGFRRARRFGPTITALSDHLHEALVRARRKFLQPLKERRDPGHAVGRYARAIRMPPNEVTCSQVRQNAGSLLQSGKTGLKKSEFSEDPAGWGNVGSEGNTHELRHEGSGSKEGQKPHGN